MLQLKHSCKGFKTSNDVRISRTKTCFRISVEDAGERWPWNGDCVTIRKLQLYYYWREKKKRKLFFLLNLHFVSLCYAVEEICSVLLQPWTWRCSKRKLKEIHLWGLEKNRFHINQKFKESDLKTLTQGLTQDEAC